jgi:hypothetical protein
MWIETKAITAPAITLKNAEATICKIRFSLLSFSEFSSVSEYLPLD